MIKRLFRILRIGSGLDSISKGFVAAIILLGIASAHAQPSGNLSPAQKASVQALIHDYLLAHPEVVAQAMQEEQQNQEAAQRTARETGIVTAKTALLRDPNTPVIGNPQGSITLIEFADDQCPYCKAMIQVVDNLIDKNPKLRVVMKDMPILGPVSEYAARIGLIAEKQGKYEAYRKAVAAQTAPLSEQEIWNAALASGLNIPAAKAEMDAPWVNSELAEDTTLAKSLQIEGTPAFIVGNVLIDGGTSEGHLESLLAGEAKS
jgi:protein-disulfide isomerase